MKILRLIALLAVLTTLVGAQHVNMVEVAHLNQYSSDGYTDCWGYTAPDGREYAFLGVYGGVSIVDATDPEDIHEVDFVPWVYAGWYDMKTLDEYMYVSSEGSENVLIVDISDLPNSTTIIGEYGNFPTDPHNIYLDQEAEILYVIEDFNSARTVSLHSLADRENPVEISIFGPGLGTDAHDLYAFDGIAYVAEGINGSIGIFDVADPADPSLIQRIDVPSPGYVHNVWVTDDHSYMISTEETTDKTIKMWNIEDLDNAHIVDEYLPGPNALAHNAFFEGDFAYISHYGYGTRILDIADPNNMVEVGSFDVAGSQWGIYPYTNHGLLYLSDMGAGLYVADFIETYAYRLAGTVTDAQSGNPIENAWVEVEETESVDLTSSDGAFSIGYGGEESELTVRVVAVGYELQEVVFTVVPGQSDNVNFALNLTAYSSVAGIVANSDGTPLSDIDVSLTLNSFLLETPEVMTTTTGSDGSYEFDALAVSDDDYIAYTDLSIAQTFPYGEQVIAEVMVEEGGPTEIDFVSDPAHVMVINNSNSDEYIDYYVQSLAELSVLAYVWNNSALPVSQMDALQNNTVIWVNGEVQPNALSQAERDSLTLLLDTGGDLLISGTNVGQWLGPVDPDFMQNYFGVTSAGNAQNTPAVISPVASNAAFGDMTGFAVEQESRDAFDLVTAEAAFEYSDGLIGGITHDNQTNGSQVVFLGFSPERATPESAFIELLDRTLGWFDVTTDIDDEVNIPASIELAQNYPNPFNPSTTIRLQLPSTSHVQLVVYDALGRTVRELANGTVGSGSHDFVWDGTNSTGSQVASGVYFYRLTANSVSGQGQNFIETRKMLLAR